MNTDHLLIQLEQPGEGQEPRIIIEMDTEEPSQFRVFSICDYTLTTSSPTPPHCLGRNITLPMVEYLIFHHEDAKQLQYWPNSEWSLQWVGKHAGSHIVDGRTVRMLSKVVAVAKVSYSARFDRWELPVAAMALPRVAIVAMCGDERSPATAQGDQPGAEAVVERAEYSDGTSPMPPDAAEPVYYDLSIIDDCTGDPVEGATVTTAYGGGVSTNMGAVTIGPVTPGERVELHIKGDGVDNRTDKLNNKFFIA